MAKKEKTPAERAQYSYDTKKEYDKLYTAKDRAKDKHKVNKEYRKLEKRDKLPGFIITIIVFVLFVGVFTGLYTQYDYELELSPKEFNNIDISDSSKVLGSRLENSFLSFFLTLDNISSSADSVINFISANNTLSDDSEVNLYLFNLKRIALLHIDNESYNSLMKFSTKQALNKFISAYANYNYSYVSGFSTGWKHLNFAHNYDFEDICAAHGWDAELEHENFVNYKICHYYLGNEYFYCSEK